MLNFIAVSPINAVLDSVLLIVLVKTKLVHSIADELVIGMNYKIYVLRRYR